MHVRMLESLARLMDELPSSPTVMFSDAPDETYEDDLLEKNSQSGPKGKPKSGSYLEETGGSHRTTGLRFQREL